MSSEAIESPWKSSFFIDTATTNSAEYTARSKQLLDTLDQIDPQAASPKSGVAVSDDWPKQREGPDMYASGAGPGNDPNSAKVTLPSLPSIMLPIPMTPSNLWMSGFSPWIMPVFSPVLTNAMSPILSTNSPVFATTMNPLLSLSSPLLTTALSPILPTSSPLSNAMPCGSTTASKIPKTEPEVCALRDTSHRDNAESGATSVCITPQTLCKPQNDSSIKLSMPPKYIKRRVRSDKSEDILPDKNGQTTEDSCDEAFGLVVDPAITNDQTQHVPLKDKEPFKFKKPNPRKKTKLSICNSKGSKKIRDTYQHIWIDQRDAIAESLSAIGFRVLHPEKNVYGCSLCDAKYTKRMFLIRHAQRCHIHTKPYECEKCGVGCSRVDTLLRHMKRFHNTD